MYVYDTDTGLWYRQDSTRAVAFACANGVLYMVDDGGDLWSLDTAGSESVTWSMETPDLADGDPDKAGMGRLQLRLELEPGAWAEAAVQFDSCGIWQTCGRVTGQQRKRTFVLPLIPRRCDHYRIRVTGRGGCRLHSLTREYYPSTEI